MPNSIQAHIRTEQIAGFIANVIINGGLGWLFLRERSALALNGPEGFAADLLITAFLLCLLLTSIVVALQRKKLRADHYPTIAGDAYPVLRRIIKRLPSNLLAASCCVGITGVIFFGAPTVALFEMFEVSQMTLFHYLVFKSLWAGVLATLITPLAVLFPAFKRKATSFEDEVVIRNSAL